MTRRKHQKGSPLPSTPPTTFLRICRVLSWNNSHCSLSLSPKKKILPRLPRLYTWDMDFITLRTVHPGVDTCTLSMRFYWYPTPLADLISPLSSSLGCRIGSTAVVRGRYTNSFFFFFFFSCLKSLTYSYTWTDSAIESANTSWKSARPKTGIVFFLLFRSLWRLW
jgi:hypothetical protein